MDVAPIQYKKIRNPTYLVRVRMTFRNWRDPRVHIILIGKLIKKEARSVTTRPMEKLRTTKLVWMLYYNRTLYQQGIISEKEFNKMRLKIQERYDPREKNKA